jgi:hypothetical protein
VFASLFALKMSFNQLSEARTLGGSDMSVMLHMHDDYIGLICFSEKIRQKAKRRPIVFT